MDNQNISLNEGQENVVDSQPVEQVDTTVNEPVNAGNEEVATPQADVKPVQTAEQNAEFARVRREAETKAKDQMISEMYGESHGIHTYAEYKRLLVAQKAGVDPDALMPLFEEWKQTDPEYQSFKESQTKMQANETLSHLNNELKEIGLDLQIKDLTTEELSKLPNIKKINDYMDKGHDLTEAFFLANKKEVIDRRVKQVEAETIKKLQANATASPGALGTNGDEAIATNVWSMGNEDFKTMKERVLRGEYRKS